MSKTVNLKIDGRDVSVPEGTNLIEAAETAGIHIPNLCYLKGMRGIGACRMCLVEIEGAKGHVVACITRAKEGMNVRTTTEQIEEMRKFILDLILSMHPLDCMTCTKAGVCTLQQYAYAQEIKESNFTRKKFGFSADESNPFIKRDPDYCILCARCVRVCKEQGTNVLEFMGRGVGAKVVTALDRPLQESGCTFCGSCVDACPVNAILEADRWRKGREWEYDKTQSVCLSCGSGCEITVGAKDGNVVKVNAGADEGSVERFICAIGRFGFDSLVSDARVTLPMKKAGNGLKETSWEDALKTVAEKLKKSGRDTGFISSASILNQDASVLSKFASDVLKTKNVDSTASLYADEDSLTLSDSLDSLDHADLFVLVGLDPSQWKRVLPALDASLRKRVARGARLISVNSSETAIASAAAVSIVSDEANSLAQITRAMIEKGARAGSALEAAVSGAKTTEETVKAAELIAGAATPVILCAPSLFNAARNLSLLRDIKVIAVPYEANARGVVSAGLTTKGLTYREMINGGVDVLYVVGDVPVRKRPHVPFLIVQAPYMTDLAKQADIVLPAAAFLESRGTVTDYLGRRKDLEKAIEPAGASLQHKDIFIELSKVMGKPVKESAVRAKKAAGKTQKPKVSPFGKKEGLETDPLEFNDAVLQCVINSSRLLWLKETEKAAAR